MKRVGRDGDWRRHVREAMAVPAGALCSVIVSGILIGVGILVGVVAFSGAPASELARRALFWTGPALILAASTGGHLAGRLVEGSATRMLIAASLSAVAATMVVLAILNLVAAEAFDFHSVSIALGIDEPARSLQTSVPGNTAPSESADRAMRRTLRAAGWLTTFIALIIVAGATGGWIAISQVRQAREPRP